MEPVRRILDGRRADTVQRLLDAAVEEIRAAGYPDLSVRSVAKRAEVSPATAYTYFSSKDHLVSSVVWRKIQEATRTQPAGAALRDVVYAVTQVFAEDPALSQACTTALLANDPEVRRLRDQIGGEILGSMEDSLSSMPSDVVEAMMMALVGGLVLAGTGYLPFEDIPDRLAGLVERLAPAGGRRKRQSR